MKLVYIGLNKFNNKYLSLFKSYGIEYIHYKNTLKAIDNFIEIEPEIVFFNKDNFPRLWKIALKALRENFTESSTLFILEGNLNDNDLKAFKYLKGNLLIEKNNESLALFQNLLKETFKEINIDKTYFPEENEISLGFVKPDDFSFINGQIIKLSEKNFSFKSELPDESNNLSVDTIINNASLSINDTVITINFKIISINDIITCEVLQNSEEYKSLSNTLFV